jgi:hypothetical protein
VEGDRTHRPFWVADAEPVPVDQDGRFAKGRPAERIDPVDLEALVCGECGGLTPICGHIPC